MLHAWMVHGLRTYVLCSVLILALLGCKKPKKETWNMDWDSMSADEMKDSLDRLDKHLWEMKLDGFKLEVRFALRAFVRDEFDPHGDAPWEQWFPMVAHMYLLSGDGGQLSAYLFGNVVTAARVITGRPLPPGAPAFPAPEEERSWSSWPALGTPPPIKRAGQPVVSPHGRIWERLEYDVWQWDVMYDLLTRLKHLGDLSMLDLHPLLGIDPNIVLAPEFGGDPTFDFRVSVNNRPPMGMVVALLLAREIAYVYAYEWSCDEIGFWIFETVTGQPLDPRSQPPPWLEPELEARFKAFEPEAMLELSRRSIEHFHQMSMGIMECDGTDSRAPDVWPGVRSSGG
jgi:hypothetical protein